MLDTAQTHGIILDALVSQTRMDVMVRNQILHAVEPPTCGIGDLASGDLVAYAPVSWRHSPLGWAIGRTVSAATWPWNVDFPVCHMGIVARTKSWRSRVSGLAIYESTIDGGLGRCISTGRVGVKGVQAHWTIDRMRLHLLPDSRGGRAWRLPLLREAWRNPTSASYCGEGFLEHSCASRLRVPYDLGGAFRARFFGLGWTRRFRPTRTDANRKLYCNEYCLEVYDDMGWLGDDVIPSKENPKSTVALLVDRGICGPPEEILLS